MFNVIFAALGRILTWCLSSGAIKWAIMAFLWFGLVVLLDVVISLLPTWFTGEGLSSSSNFTPQIWFFMDYFNVQLGISMTLAAFATRFLIRRIPFIG